MFNLDSYVCIVVMSQTAMATMKSQFSELRSIHDNQMKVLEETRQTSKVQLDQWEAEKTKLVSVVMLCVMT